MGSLSVEKFESIIFYGFEIILNYLIAQLMFYSSLTVMYKVWISCVNWSVLDICREGGRADYSALRHDCPWVTSSSRRATEQNKTKQIRDRRRTQTGKRTVSSVCFLSLPLPRIPAAVTEAAQKTTRTRTTAERRAMAATEPQASRQAGKERVRRPGYPGHQVTHLRGWTFSAPADETVASSEEYLRR